LPSFSLSKSNLLTKPWEYKRVYGHGKRARGNHFSLIYLPNQLGENRLGISVHGVKSAVKRNRLKRIVREFFRHHRSFTDWGSATPTSTGLDVILAIRKEFSPDTPQRLERTLRDLLTKKPLEIQLPRPGCAGVNEAEAVRR
jgi:ribonuclease P protein component